MSDPTTFVQVRQNDSDHTDTSDALVAKRNSTVLVCGKSGIDALAFNDNGLIIDDTRWVSRFKVLPDKSEGDVISSALSSDGAQIILAYLWSGRVEITRHILVDEGQVFEQIELCNISDSPVHFPLVIEYASDFATIFEMRGDRRTARGRFDEPDYRDFSTVLSYSGLDNRLYRAVIAFSEMPAVNSDQQAVFNLALGSGTSVTLNFRYGRGTGDEPRPSAQEFEQALARVAEAAGRFSAASAQMSSSDPFVSRWLERSLVDLNMLMMETESGYYPAAGLPWYATQFGRDGIITALQTLLVNPDVARGVLGFLAANQAREQDAWIAAEPGKIGHEFRRDEMSMTGEKPFRRYYGGADTTLLFVMLAGEYLKKTGDIGFIRTIGSSIADALGWMEANRAGGVDGFISYDYGNGGVLTQFWKDSDGAVVHLDSEWGERDLPEEFFSAVDLQDMDALIEALNARLLEVHGFITQPVLVSHFHARGFTDIDRWHVAPRTRKEKAIRSVYRSKLMPKGPVAPSALQGYAYAAMLAAADIDEALGKSAAENWREKAELFKEAFDKRFWLADDGFYALALDGDGRSCRVMGSDMGHLLYSGIVPEDKAGLLVAKLMDEHSFSDYGIRTMADNSDVAGFGYLSYHNGSIWPHDCAIAAAGMARYGYYDMAAKVMAAIAEASAFVDGRLFEVYSGAPRVDGMPPEKYHAACAPQAWSAGAAFMLVESALGLEKDASGQLRAIAGNMPEFLPDIVINNFKGCPDALRVISGPDGRPVVMTA